MRKWLKELRGDLSQKEFAKTLGLSQNFYSCLESGNRNPSVKVAMRISNILGVEWTRFFPDNP